MGRWPEMTLEERFWVKVNKQAPNGCWEWIGAMSGNGYGSIRIDHKARNAHRVSYELVVGLIPEGLTLDHLCRNRACVNPEHLEPVTIGVNTLRGESVSAINARKTHCVNGHEFTLENTYIRRQKGGYGRMCRECGRDSRRRTDNEEKRQRARERTRAWLQKKRLEKQSSGV